jgi:hypothetical protein
MTQTVVQSGTDSFGGTSATATVALTSVVAGNSIEVRVSTWGLNVSPDCTVSDGTHTYLLAARSQRTGGSDNNNAEIHYVLNATAGSYTVTVTTAAASPNRYGWIWVGEIAGRATTGALNSGATGTANGTSATPSVTGAGSTTDASCLIVGVLTVSGGSALGIDAANGNSLTWTNRSIHQDATAEIGESKDDAPATSTLTPSLNWGAVTGQTSWSACVVAFKDADIGGGGGNTLMGQVCT